MSNADDIIEIEMDEFPTAFRPTAPSADDIITLDMTDIGQTKCVDCGGTGSVNDAGRCRGCVADAAAVVEAPVAELARDLTAIGAAGAANASVQALGSMRTGELRGVGFATKEGYIEAIRHGVKACTHASYLTTLRTQYGMRTVDIDALNLPGPMVESALPVGAGIAHVPAGHKEGSAGIFDRKDRTFVVGPKAEAEETTSIKLEHGKLVAGAVATGNGVLVGWRGLGQLTRGALSEALQTIERTDLLPVPLSAHAQAGIVVGQFNQSVGFVVRASRKVKDSTWSARWTIGAPNHTNQAGASFGDIVLTVELSKEGVLSFDGDVAMSAKIQTGYDARIASEVYQAGDVTNWLANKLHREFKAVSFGIGYYVPSKFAAAAEALCTAVSKTGWGYGWVVPALPIADCDQLRDGIVRGLTEEVSDLMARLATERATAKAERVGADIGPKRAGTFLKDLRAIGQRAVAYGQMIGEERIAKCRDTVRAAVVELETLLGDDFSGIGQRFSLIWEEIEADQRRSGGTL